MKLRFLKFLDGFIGPPVVRLAALLLRTPSAADRSAILFIRPGGIGDAVLLIPAIQAMKCRFPDATIDVLAEKRNCEVFSLCPDVGRVYRYDRPKELLSAVQGAYAVVIDTEQWHRLSAVVARLVRAPTTLGFATNERKKLFTHSIAYAQDDYELDSFLHLIEPLAGTATQNRDDPFVTVPEPSRSTVRPLLHALRKNKIVTLFPGGSIAERRWGSERFREVAKRLSDRGHGIVVVGGKDDAPAGEDIVRVIRNSLSLCGQLSLPETAAVLQESALLVSGDSGVMHLGYAVGTKVIALFGPGREKKWAPQSSRVAVINKQLACSPCTTFGYTPKCSKNALCLSGITVDEVVQQALSLLGTA